MDPLELPPPPQQQQQQGRVEVGLAEEAPAVAKGAPLVRRGTLQRSQLWLLLKAASLLLCSSTSCTQQHLVGIWGHGI